MCFFCVSAVEREVVQKRTFTRWMNLHLEKCDPPLKVDDLFQDVQDGRVLMALLEELSGCRLLHGFKKSSHRIFRLNNIAKVLSFLEERNVKLISIDAADVADGNSSIILGLIWNIILFFQIKELTGNIRSQFPSCSSLSSLPTSSDSDASFPSAPSDERPSSSSATREHGKAIKRLLQWVQKRTRKYSVAVQDFGRSWTNGLAFLAVIKSIDPSLVDMRKALLRTPRENLEDAFRAAHYSLGIPRLLEPEDVTINAPDEQSIMTYVSQFLEHFPGIEEPEEPCTLTERSVSMGRLNLRDYDSEHLRNGTHRSHVRETACMFQKDRVRPPPKILISSVSEDQGVMSPAFKPAVARSWVSEDFLARSTTVEDTYMSMKRGPQEHASEDFSHSCIHSPTGSSVPESTITESTVGDSAISSPDSWLENEFGAVSHVVCESHSDSLLCDSGTPWDMNLLNATTSEEISGVLISTTERAPDEQPATELYTDEGIYSLSSMESTRDQIQQHLDHKQDDNHIRRPERDPDQHQEGESAVEADPRQKYSGVLEVDQVLGEQEPSFRLCDTKYLENTAIIQTLEGDEHNQIQPSSNTRLPNTEPTEQNTFVTSECLKEAEDEWDTEHHIEKVDPACQDSLFQQPREETGTLKEGDDEPKETPEMQDCATKGVLSSHTGPEDSINTKMLNSFAANQNEAPKTVQGPTTAMNISLSSFSTDTAENNPEERQDQDRGENPWQAGVSEDTGTETCFISSQNPNLMTSALAKGDDNPKHVRAADLEKMTKTEDGRIHGPDQDHTSALSNAGSTGLETADNMEKRQSRCEGEPSHGHSHIGGDQLGMFTHTSTDADYSPGTQQEMETDLADRALENQDNLSAVFPASHLVTRDGDTSDPLVACGDVSVAGGARGVDLFYTDFGRSSPTEDLVVDLLEPMDLFYPDKEEHMFTESSDHEMERWPSVLSVSSLEPAPASESLPVSRALGSPPQDFRNGVDLIEDPDKVIPESQSEEPGPQESFGPDLGGRRGREWPVGGSDGSELRNRHSTTQNAVRSDNKSRRRPDENQIPPSLGPRRVDSWLESQARKTAVRKLSSQTEVENVDCWCRDSWEPYVLLLLWLLLYCVWLMPQMDLRDLPGLLLNLHH
ncbi:calmin [Thalassophryne amazonica]|uniref:calmin n=1 Tax=Thalassophryne amazonica TaxID=390379 RepID=UPI001471BA3D|nr:calmin [Thalassophryne amazonica]